MQPYFAGSRAAEFNSQAVHGGQRIDLNYFLESVMSGDPVTLSFNLGRSWDVSCTAEYSGIDRGDTIAAEDVVPVDALARHTRKRD